MSMFCRSLFVLFLYIVLSVLRGLTDSDYPVGIFKLVLITEICLYHIIYRVYHNG